VLFEEIKVSLSDAFLPNLSIFSCICTLCSSYHVFVTEGREFYLKNPQIVSDPCQNA
jgi:Zn finger protein HypA/HybF involved in hydrogenase expression